MRILILDTKSGWDVKSNNIWREFLPGTQNLDGALIPIIYIRREFLLGTQNLDGTLIPIITYEVNSYSGRKV